MSDISRRSFTTLSAGFVLGSASNLEAADVAPAPHALRTEAPFERDYPAPQFNPSWKKPQINKLLVQDFVVFSHMDLPMVKKLLAREPGLLNATMDWGGGDWESGLNAASHMGRHDIIEFLLEKGARIDIFCAAAMGLTDVVKAFLTLQPNLIDAPGPHGLFNLHVHAQMGGERSAKTLDYLQSVKKLELKPFMKKK
jgi:hypothetical protein